MRMSMLQQPPQPAFGLLAFDFELLSLLWSLPLENVDDAFMVPLFLGQCL